MSPKLLDAHVTVADLRKEQAKTRMYRSRLSKTLTENRKLLADKKMVKKALSVGRHNDAANVDFVALVGTSPSPGGPRAPLSKIFSHASIQISPSTTEFYRWRIARFVVELDSSQFQAASAVGLGMICKFDETPMKVFWQTSRSVGAMVRVLRIVSYDGSVYTRAPTLRVPSKSNWLGLYSCLRVEEEFQLGSLAGDGSRFKYLVFSPDEAAVNRSVVRAVCKYSSHWPKLLIFRTPCWAHVINNATKLSLSSFPLGSLLRTAHVIQTRGDIDFYGHCLRMLRDEPFDPDAFEGSDCVSSWTYFLDFFYTEGPYGRLLSTQRRNALLSELTYLWPAGVPVGLSTWARRPGASNSRYSAALKCLFSKTFPTPILSRFYSVESACWRIMCLRCFHLVALYIPDTLEMRWWPGDDISCVDQDDPLAFEEVSGNRLNRVRTFLQSPSLFGHLAVCCISSLPRWRFCRILEAKDATQRGFAFAFRSMSSMTDDIISGRCGVAEYFLRGCVSESRVRASVAAALMRSLLYVKSKFAAYSSLVWDAVLGDISVASLVEQLLSPDVKVCCLDSACSLKIRNAFVGLEGSAYTAALSDLEVALRSVGAQVLQRGGSTNIECESLFSICRQLGTKMPFRPMKMSTLWRELLLRYCSIEHKRWFKAVSRQIFDSSSLPSRKSVRWTGFTCFMSSLGIELRLASDIWSNLPVCERQRWARKGCALSSSQRADLAAVSAEICSSSVPVGQLTGPFGSSTEKMFIDPSSVYQRLCGPADDFSTRWRRSFLTAWKSSFDRCVGFKTFTSRDHRLLARIVMPDSECLRCRASTHASTRSLTGLWRILLLHDAEDNGSYGFCVGVSHVDSSTDWYCVFHLQKRPWKAYCAPVETWSMRASDGDRACIVPVDGRLCSVDSRSRCLLRLLSYSASTLKSYTITHITGWSCEQPGTFSCSPVGVLYDAVLSVQRPPRAVKRRARGPGHRAAAASPARKKRNFMDAFFSDFSASSASSTSSTPSVGCDDSDGVRSEAPLASSDCCSLSDASSAVDHIVVAAEAEDPLAVAFARLTPDECSAVCHELAPLIDSVRYSVTCNYSTGVLTVTWKASEISRMKAALLRARHLYASAGGVSAHFTHSRSATLHLHGREAASRILTDWHYWHAAWIYGFSPPSSFSADFILPGSLAPWPASSNVAAVGADCSDFAESSQCSSVCVDAESVRSSSSSVSSSSAGTMSSVQWSVLSGLMD